MGREEAEARGLAVIEEVGFGWTLVGDAVRPGAAGDAVAEVARSAGFAVEPNYVLELAVEPLFSEQWALENTGQAGGTAGADIDILGAWGISTGSPEVVIAVLDTGVAASHSDLSPNLWENTDEIPGNSIDDDGNGWVDDVAGWDAYDADADPDDTHGHGTFVATTAAAALNDVGMSGAAPGATVMPVRVCTGTGCPTSAIVAGLAYAVANGADVANLSFGGNIPHSALMETAIREAVDAGMVIVAAAGNNASNNDSLPYYPAGFDVDGLLAVAASDRDDALAGFSNFGAATVDLVAPGADVLGGLPPNTWTSGSGTSFSTPLVSGVAALIRTVRPDLDPADIAGVVTDTVDRNPGLLGRVETGGRLDAGKAMLTATSPIAIAKATPAEGVLPLTVLFSSASSRDPWGTLVSRSWLLPDGSVSDAVDVVWVPSRPGTYQATLTVTDDDGLVDVATVSLIAQLPPGGSFDDDNGHFAERAIEAIKAEGITLGCNPPANDRFCPEEAVTRGQMAAFVARSLGLPASDVDHFADDDGDIFESAIDRLATARITVGCNPPANDRFCPERSVTRAEMAAFLVRAFDLGAGSGSDVFEDDDGVLENAIDKLAAAGITTGCNPPANDRFCPNQPVTRGEMAVFLTRALGLSPITPPPT